MNILLRLKIALKSSGSLIFVLRHRRFYALAEKILILPYL